MYHTFSHGIAFGILGSVVGVLAGSFAIPNSTTKDAYWGFFLGCGTGIIFGAILGLSQAVDDLRDQLDTDPEKERRRMPPLGGALLPRFEETAAKPPLPSSLLDNGTEPPSQDEP